MRLVRTIIGLLLIAHATALPVFCADGCCRSELKATANAKSHCHEETVPASTLTCGCTDDADGRHMLALAAADPSRRPIEAPLISELPPAFSVGTLDQLACGVGRPRATQSPPRTTRKLNLRI